MRFDDAAHVGEGPALDHGQRLEHHATLGQLPQDVRGRCAGRNVVAAGLDLGPAAHAQLQLDAAPVGQRATRVELGQNRAHRSALPDLELQRLRMRPAACIMAAVRCQ
jgi:hypothetical protein